MPFLCGWARGSGSGIGGCSSLSAAGLEELYFTKQKRVVARCGFDSDYATQKDQRPLV